MMPLILCFPVMPAETATHAGLHHMYGGFDESEPVPVCCEGFRGGFLDLGERSTMRHGQLRGRFLQRV